MLDIKFIRENPEKIKKACQAKQVKVDIEKLLEVDGKRRELLQKIENLRADQNKLSKKGKPGVEEIKKLKKIKGEIQKIEKDLEKTERKYSQLMFQIPNPPLKDVPLGKNERGNRVLKKVGEPTKFDFQPKDYIELSKNLDLIDTERAAKVSGSRFGYLKRESVLVEFALVKLAFDTLREENFIPIIPPVMISDKAMRGTGYLDQGGEKETYWLPKDKLYLIATSEHALAAYHMAEVLEEKNLPIRYVGFSTCFRREAGSYGKDTRGILRVHQFDKIEMFSFVKPEESEKEHQFLLSMEEKLMKALKIPYQVVEICTGDLGMSAAAKYDIEAWFPGGNNYRETHSTSNCTDFQARRLNIRYRNKKGETTFVHTLNGTAFSQRPILAILENYQTKEGKIKIPEVLREYLGGRSLIGD